MLIAQYAQSITSRGVRQFVVLQDLDNRAQITVVFELYDNQTILRYSLKYKNLTPATSHITWINMVPWTFGDLGKRYTAFRVNQWSVAPSRRTSSRARPAGQRPVRRRSLFRAPMASSAVGSLFATATSAAFSPAGNSTAAPRPPSASSAPKVTCSSIPRWLDSTSGGLHRASSRFPMRFLGLFHGDWDEAGYRTQRFVEACWPNRPPDQKTFPYVSWDSWAYAGQIDESDAEAQRRPGRATSA